MNLLTRSESGVYYCDPEALFISRIIFRYIPLLGKCSVDAKNYCGDWHRITLIRWEIEYLTYKRVDKKKGRYPFP